MSILICCGVCQILSTIFSTLEMFWSEYTNHTKLQVFQDPSGFKFSGYIELCLTMKYLGAFVHVFASCFFFNFVYNQHGSTLNIRTMVAKSAWFMTSQLLGVTALCVRLGVLLIYRMGTACAEAVTPTFESFHQFLGISAVFGLFSLFLIIFYIGAHMYHKLNKIEEERGIMTMA